MLYLFLDVQLNKSKMAESMTTSSTYLALLSCSSFSSLPSASWTRLNSKPCCLIKKQFQWPPWSLGRDPLIIRPFCSPWGASKAQTQISGEVRQTLESWIPHPQYLRTPSTFKSAAPSTSQIMNAQLASNNWCQSHQNMEKEHAKHSPAHVRGQKGQRMGYHLHHPSHLGMSEELQFRRLDWYQGPAAPINQGHHEAKLVPGLIKYNLAEKMMKINIIHHLCIQNPMYTIGKRLPDTNLMSNAFPQTCFLKQISLACQACSRCSSCRAARSVLRSIGSLESKGANWRVHGNSDLISASQFPVGTTLTQDRAPWMKHQAQSHPKTGHDAWGACGSQIGEWTESPPPSHWKCWITRYSDADQGTCALVHWSFSLFHVDACIMHFDFELAMAVSKFCDLVVCSLRHQTHLQWWDWTVEKKSCARAWRYGGWDTLWNLIQNPIRALPPPMLSWKENTYTVEDLHIQYKICMQTHKGSHRGQYNLQCVYCVCQFMSIYIYIDICIIIMYV